MRDRGLDWVPEPLGIDDAGREVWSFIPGEVLHEPPAWLWSEDTLRTAAVALRRWHDATSDFDGSGAVWGFDARAPPEVICHNDFAPYNCVFRERRLVGVIDFDTCALGPRIWDIAHTAYRFVPLAPPLDARAPPEAVERSPFSAAGGWTRLEQLLDAYADHGSRLRPSAEETRAAAVTRLSALAALTAARAARTADATLGRHAAMYRAHAAWLAGA